MPNTGKLETVSIRPAVSMLRVLQHLKYRPWFAMAEFVDNSLQSYRAHIDKLTPIGSRPEPLQVSISLDQALKQITIRDNAGGIPKSEYPRAFRPAAKPTDTSGLSEFGMGMKSAACWFSPKWSVRTVALGEKTERTVCFDIDSIVKDEIEELKIAEKTVPVGQHFTEVVLSDCHNFPAGRTAGKIKEHLADIYRCFTREGVIKLFWNFDELKYEEPPVLRAPFYKNPSGKPVIWKHSIDFDLGAGLHVTGFAAIRERANTSRAGFALFRRGRLIEGSGDEGYRPEFIFGRSNSYAYQRLFGELHLEGFEVAHTKDGFVWEENEQPFLELLKEQLQSEDMPMLQQIREYRVRPPKEDVTNAATQVVERAAEAVQKEMPMVVSTMAHLPPTTGPLPKELPKRELLTNRSIPVVHQNVDWLINIELAYDPAIGDWLEIYDRPSGATIGPRRLGIRIALSHPFVVQFCGADQESLEPIVRLGVALAVAEVVAMDSGVAGSGTIRRNVNALLRDALCQQPTPDEQK